MRIIAGEARGRTFEGPLDRNVRPLLDRIRESLFSRLEESLEGAVVLDLFAGVGSFGLEAISRGVRRAVFVERSPATLAILRRNVERLGFASRAEVIQGNALELPHIHALPRGSIAVAFLDPPFAMLGGGLTMGPVLARTEALRSSEAMAPGAVVLLRCPRDVRRHGPFGADEQREYGASMIYRFDCMQHRADSWAP